MSAAAMSEVLRSSQTLLPATHGEMREALAGTFQQFCGDG
jgi:hypothetical protein